MPFEDLPLCVRDVHATENVLRRIYEAARLGLRGDSLALHAGLLPSEYRTLTVHDPLAEQAELQGRADSEATAAAAIHAAIATGDAKIALDYLKHRHDWVAKQAISIENHTSISITDALSTARERIITIEGTTNAANQILAEGRTSAHGRALEPPDSEQPGSVRDVCLPLGTDGDAAGELQGPEKMAKARSAGDGKPHRRKRATPSV